MLEKLGIGGVFEFAHQNAVRGMEASHAAMATLARTSTTLTAGVGQLSGAFFALGLATAPFGAYAALGTKQAADFEFQMDAVGAITRSTEEDQRRLEYVAKQTGATTVFTATQSAEAMENLARAGANTGEIIGALPGTVALAAAENVTLAQAADITASVMRAMNLEFSEAGRVSDFLTFVSAKTNTNVLLLGEAYKYAASESYSFGIQAQELAVALGAVSDSGLKGTLAGTSFKNMLIRLAKPTSDGIEYTKLLGAEIVKNADGTLNLLGTMQSYAKGLDKVKDRTTAVRIANELFGEEGGRAFMALRKSIEQGRLPQLLAGVEESAGYAAEAAERRLGNLKGQITLLKSAFEGFNLEVFGQMLGPIAKGLAPIVKFIADIAAGLQAINYSDIPEARAKWDGLSKTVQSIVYGIKNALFDIGYAIQAANNFLDDFTTSMQSTAETADAWWMPLKAGLLDVRTYLEQTFGDDWVRTITRFGTLFTLVAGMLAPLFVALSGFSFVFSQAIIPAISAFWTILSGIGGAIASVFSLPVLAAIAAVVGGFMLIRKDGETVWETVKRIGQGFLDTFDYIWENILKPFVDGFMKLIGPTLDQLGRLWNGLRTEFQEFFEDTKKVFNFLAPLFEAVFHDLGKVVSWFVGFAVQQFSWLFEFVIPILKGIVMFLVEGVLGVIQELVRGVVMLADALPVGEMELHPAWRKFAEQDDLDLNWFDWWDDAPEDQGDLMSSAENASHALDEVAEAEQNASYPAEIKVENVIEDKRKIEIDNKLCVDGRELSIATARHQQELHERAGFKSTPWQRRVALEQGGAPIGSGGMRG